jgi:preprotein translocase subunit SecD
LFDEMATTCVQALPECPTNQLAFVLDGEVLSDPTFQTTSFGGSAVITGDFSEDEAKNIAIALRYGALPVSFENQGVQTVSASIGDDALEAGVISGIIGLTLVAIFIIGYYRYLGVVAMASLALSVSMLWTIIAWLGSSRGLALTLAGITGIIVSIGVSLDSNIVYFEHLKEDVRNGRTPRSSVDRAFPIAFSTIVKADVASLIGAALLYWLTTGAVRGFALYLGVATLLDLVATYFFLGPAVRLIARRDGFAQRPSSYGIPAPGKTTGASK